MGWEVVDALPGVRTGGAFRGRAEPVVAERPALTTMERLRLQWHSTPEQPRARAADRVVLTPAHLYVKRVDGTIARVRLTELHGERLERGRMIYGVREDEDLLLIYRSGCPVQDHLSAAVRGVQAVGSWQETRGMEESIVLSSVAFCLGVGLLISYPFDAGLAHIGRGFATSEVALGMYGGIASLLFGWLLLLFGPSRWRVDAVGLTRTRGVFPWFVFRVPPTWVRRMCLRPAYRKPNNAPRYHSGWWVELELGEPMRVGSLRKQARIELELFRFGEASTTDLGRARAESEAKKFAERLRVLLSLEEETRVDER